MRKDNASILSAVIASIVGVVLIIEPGLSLIYISYALATVALISSINSFIKYFKSSEEFKNQSDLFGAIIAACIFVIFMVRPKSVMSMLPVLIGCMILAVALSILLMALSFKKKGSNVTPTIVGCIITIIISILIVTNPFNSAKLVMMFVGCGLLVGGISAIINIMQIKKYKKKNGIVD